MGKLINLIFSQGERYPMLVDDDGVPDYWVTLFVTENLRIPLKQTAIENTIRNLIHLRLWEAINSRDLISEFSQEKFLSEADIFSIRDHCLIETRGLRKWLQSKDNKKVTNISVRYPSIIPNMHAVSKNHAANRLINIANFLHFTARAQLRMRSNFNSLVSDIDQMKRRIVAQKPKGLKNSGLASDPDSKAPPPEVFDALMRVVKVDSPDNPYKSPGIRIRNSLMFEILYETGMRSGEILALQIGDIDFNDSKLSVIRRHDNIIDTRKRQPVAKTRERDIPISFELSRRIRDYVMNLRSKVPNAHATPFLFVTHKKGTYQGNPLSDSTFRNIVLGLATASNPDLFQEISRHGFRHNFNYHLSKKIDAQNAIAKTDTTIKAIKEKEEIQIRKQLNGWVSDGSAEKYNLRHTNEKANKLMRESMDDMSTFLNRKKN